MSADQEQRMGTKTLKSVRELLEKAEESAHVALKKAAPKVQRSVDSSMQAASKGFTRTMKSIDGATTREQQELLKAYRRVLAAQVNMIDSRLSAMESKKQESHPQPVTSATS